MMNKNSIGRGVVYLYIEAINMIFSGYIYWLILSKITDPTSIGIASTIIAFATIVFNIASIGVTGGIQRYIANGLAEKNFKQVQGIINSSLIITTAGVFISAITILILRDSIGAYFNLDFGYILLSIALFTFMVFADIFYCFYAYSTGSKELVTMIGGIFKGLSFPLLLLVSSLFYSVTAMLGAWVGVQFITKEK